MERTPSGHSILSSHPSEPPSSNDTKTHTLSSRELDLSAARRVEAHFRRTSNSHASSKHERILYGLIHSSEPLDDVALDGIFTAANTVFFDGVLSGRVRRDWSSSDRYRTELIGTTALRLRADGDGFETLIVLSEPILRNPNYDRRLLLSAFLHELIHCYLFISCGWEARVHGGHTEGFHRIAELIDSWVGTRYLSICKLKEDPMRWHVGGSSTPDLRMEATRGRQSYILDVHGSPEQVHDYIPRSGPSHSHSPPHVPSYDLPIRTTYEHDQCHVLPRKSRSPPHLTYLQEQNHVLPLWNAPDHAHIYVLPREQSQSQPRFRLEPPHGSMRRYPNSVF